MKEWAAKPFNSLLPISIECIPRQQRTCMKVHLPIPAELLEKSTIQFNQEQV
jgi:hypothetical protein